MNTRGKATFRLDPGAMVHVDPCTAFWIDDDRVALRMAMSAARPGYKTTFSPAEAREVAKVLLALADRVECGKAATGGCATPSDHTAHGTTTVKDGTLCTACLRCGALRPVGGEWAELEA